MITQLMQYGLSQMEAEKFVSLLDLLEIPEEDVNNYEAEFDTVDPFAGQLSDAEAIIALKVAHDLDKLMEDEGWQQQ